MKITKVHAYLRQVALKKPYTIANYTFSDVSLVFLEIELANGLLGFGSGSPAEEVVGETPEQCLHALKSDIIQAMVGRNIEDFQSIIRDMQAHFVHKPGTVAAIDLALHDAYGKWQGKSVLEILGQKIRPLATSVTVGIMPVEEAIHEVRDLRQQGFSIFKIKIGNHVEDDIEKLIRLHESFPNGMTWRVDPNQGYALAELVRFLWATQQVPLELVEQPLPVVKDSSMALIPPEFAHLMMADESLTDFKRAKTLFQDPKLFHVFNVKLMKCGGIQAAREIGSMAASSGINLFWGCNDESCLSISAALHVAYSCLNTRFLDLDGSFDLAEDVFAGGFALRDGLMHVLDRPGLGVQMI
jgi:L-alanine-DL-glutamate epimerase-like enolase superfamily enzyme